jgi:hypothetical protein
VCVRKVCVRKEDVCKEGARVGSVEGRLELCLAQYPTCR